jgi:hypothetical protein
MEQTVFGIIGLLVACLAYLLWEMRMHKDYDHLVEASKDANYLIDYIREQETAQDCLDVYIFAIGQMKMYEPKIPRKTYIYHLTCLNSAYMDKNRKIMGYVFGKPLNQN